MGDIAAATVWLLERLFQIFSAFLNDGGFAVNRFMRARVHSAHMNVK